MPHKSKVSSPKLALVLALLWIAAMTFSFLSFDLTKVRSAGNTGESTLTTHLFDPKIFDQLIAPPRKHSRKTVIHFWHPNCNCSALITDHIRELIQLAETKQMSTQIVAFQPEGIKENEIRKQVQIQFGKDIDLEIISQQNAETAGIPASPSAAVLNTFGKIVYFGPYSSDAYCSTENESFVESAVIRMKDNKAEEKMGILLASGCLCDWN